MDKYERFANTESTIRKYLTSLARLEERYKSARVEEIAKGYSAKKPFLTSRSITNEMRILINKIRAIEYRHNRFASSANKLVMVEEIINEELIFIRSKEILQKILERSTAIKNGFSVSNEVEFKGGRSPTKEKLEQKAKSQALYNRLMNQANKATKIRTINSTAQDNAVASVLNNSYQESICEDMVSIKDTSDLMDIKESLKK